MITTKKATAADALLIAEMGAKTFVESHGHSAAAEDIAEYVQQKYSAEIVEAELANFDNIFYIIYYKGQPAGYSKIVFDVPNPNIPAQNVCKMERLYILKDFLDLKLGGLLFDLNIALAKQQNQAGIWLFVWTENHRAVAFYRKRGFVQVGNRAFKITEKHYNPNYEMYLEF